MNRHQLKLRVNKLEIIVPQRLEWVRDEAILQYVVDVVDAVVDFWNEDPPKTKDDFGALFPVLFDDVLFHQDGLYQNLV